MTCGGVVSGLLGMVPWPGVGVLVGVGSQAGSAGIDILG